MLVEEHANARYIPLLEELTKSKVPEVAELATTSGVVFVGAGLTLGDSDGR